MDDLYQVGGLPDVARRAEDLLKVDGREGYRPFALAISIAGCPPKDGNIVGSFLVPVDCSANGEACRKYSVQVLARSRSWSRLAALGDWALACHRSQANDWLRAVRP